MRVKVGRKRAKYKNVAAVGIDGFRYDSKQEMKYGDQLVRAKELGAVRLLLRQVPFWLPGGVRLVLDFVWVDDRGIAVFEDVKSEFTAKDTLFIAKRKLVEEHYDIEIGIVIGGVRQ